MKENQQHEIFRARARSLDTVPAAGLAIERLSVSLGLLSLEASRFRFVAEELCAARISGAFEEGEPALVHLTLELRPGEMAVIIEDSGRPIGGADAAAGARGWIAQLVRRGLADRLKASFEGREGNRCELVKSFTRKALSRVTDSAVGGSSTRAEVEADSIAPKAAAKAHTSPIEYRNMAPEDALEVARCFYRTYGLTGPIADEIIYHPDRCAEKVRTGEHLGIVATVGRGRIVGHIAIEREHLEDPVGVSGFLVVDPEFRGHGIGDKLSDLKLARGREAGLRGMLGMAVTVHTASQRTSLREHGVEVGVLLAAQEDRIAMRGIAEDAPHERHAIVAFYTPLGPDISRPSFPPAVHREIIERIYAAGGLERIIGEPPSLADLNQLPERTALGVAVMSGARFARVRVTSYGRDFLGDIFNLISDLHHHHVDVIRLELPLADPLTAHLGAAAEELGFSFAAVFPSLATGDLLCLQALDRIEVNPAAIQTASAHGAAILAAVLASRERVLRSTTARTLEGAMRALQKPAV